MLKLRAKNKNEKFNEFLFDTQILTMKNVVLAGGANRTFVDANEEINDYDIFMIGEEPKAHLLNWASQYENIFTCPDGFLYSYKTPYGKMQIVCPKIYNTVEELLDTFDLQPSRFAYDGEFLYTFKEAIKSVKKKVLDIHSVTFPLATLNRIYKYRNYGYNTMKASEEFIKLVNEGVFDGETLYRRYID